MPIPALDKTKPYGTLHGPAGGLRGAVYSQNGYNYNADGVALDIDIHPQPDPVEMAPPARPLTEEKAAAIAAGQAPMGNSPTQPPAGLENWNRNALKKALDERGIEYSTSASTEDLATLLAVNWATPKASPAVPELEPLPERTSDEDEDDDDD